MFVVSNLRNDSGEVRHDLLSGKPWPASTFFQPETGLDSLKQCDITEMEN